MIRTRQTEPDEDFIEMGHGPYRLRVDDEELEIIASLLWIVRRGNSVYEEAAANLTEAISDVLGDDYFSEAIENVDPYFVVTDSGGLDVESHNWIDIEISLEG